MPKRFSNHSRASSAFLKLPLESFLPELAAGFGSEGGGSAGRGVGAAAKSPDASRAVEVEPGLYGCPASARCGGDLGELQFTFQPEADGNKASRAKPGGSFLRRCVTWSA